MTRFAPRRAWQFAAGAVALAFAFAPSPSPAAEFVMKFGTATFNESQHQYIKFYKEAVEKAANGRIEVGIYPRSELGPIPRMIDGLQLGMFAFCCANTLVAYGAFVEALYFWDISRVSAVIATAPLFTIGAMWSLERMGFALVDAEGLNALSITGALLVVAGSVACALAARK